MRKAGYGLAGVVIGLIMYVLLLTEMPTVVSVKTNITEFEVAAEDSISDYITDDEYYKGGSVMPFSKNGSYHLVEEDIEGYTNAGIIKYGKLDPTFFFSSVPEPEEGEVDEDGVRKPTESYQGVKIDINNASKEDLMKVSGIGELRADNIIKYREENGPFKSIDELKNVSEVDEILYKRIKEYFTVGSTQNTSDERETFEGYKVTDGMGGGSKDIQRGFNIHSKGEEERDTHFIKKEFSSSGILPVKEAYYKISSKFGKRTDPIENNESIHLGLDIASEGINGEEIYSVLSGDVIATGLDSKGYGNYIIIDHGGFETLYAHMAETSPLKMGDKVEVGEVVGNIGNTGRSTGPHLHFEVSIGELKFDPEVFLSEISKGD